MRKECLIILHHIENSLEQTKSTATFSPVMLGQGEVVYDDMYDSTQVSVIKEPLVRLRNAHHFDSPSLAYSPTSLMLYTLHSVWKFLRLHLASIRMYIYVFMESFILESHYLYFTRLSPTVDLASSTLLHSNPPAPFTSDAELHEHCKDIFRAFCFRDRS